MKSAQESAEKFASRAGAASGDYVDGALRTDKDQAAAAIKGAGNYALGVQEAIADKRFEKGLQKSGKAGWQKGVEEKGATRFAEGVRQGSAKYAQESGRFDGARRAADSLPRGPKGSEQNYNRAKVVGQALRKVKTGK